MPADAPLAGAAHDPAMPDAAVLSPCPEGPDGPLLSEREQHIVTALADGVGLEQVAVDLQLSMEHLSAHLTEVVAKLLASSGAGASSETHRRPLERSRAGRALYLVPEEQAARARVRVSLFGRFTVTHGDREVTPVAPQPAQAVQLVALRGGRMHAEELIEHLWPDTDPVVARTRLRNLLAKVRRASGPLLCRDGDAIVILPDIEVDVAEYERTADQAIAAQRSDPDAARVLAASAIERYRGDVLPDARYAPWADGPRDRFQRRQATLLDIVARSAITAGDIETAVAHLEAAIALEPYDERRYLEGARLLLADGRIGAARAMLTRVLRVWRELELDPSPEVLALQASLGVGAPKPAEPRSLNR